MVNDVQQCANLGTTMYSDISNKHISNAVHDIFMRTNDLIAIFLIC